MSSTRKGTMLAMRLNKLRTPLEAVHIEVPEPGPGQIRISVSACGVCRTDLHVHDGELPHPKVPMVPGHEIVGRVEKLGDGVKNLTIGQRVGIPWLGHTCGHCYYCEHGEENLCDHPEFTGYSRYGGYAEKTVADAHFAFPLGEELSDIEMAPLLCAGLIGWRSLSKAGNGKKIGLYGFGAAAHIIAQVLKWQGREVYAFTRDGDTKKQEFAKSLGAVWAGGSTELPPEKLDAVIIFAAAGPLVPQSLKVIRKGGIVVCAGIHMSTIPAFSYDDLWEERQIVSVANLTRQDGIDFFKVAAKAKIRTATTTYKLTDANQALEDLRHGRFEGAAVLKVAEDAT